MDQLEDFLEAQARLRQSGEDRDDLVALLDAAAGELLEGLPGPPEEANGVIVGPGQWAVVVRPGWRRGQSGSDGRASNFVRALPILRRP